MFWQDEWIVKTAGRGFTELTSDVTRRLQHSGVNNAIAQLFCRHTSASLLILENAAPAVQADMERFMARLVADGDPLFAHTDEGPDDMPAHIRSVLTGASIGFPVKAARPALGTWQGLFLYEHRYQPQQRQLVLSVYGE